MEGLIEEEIEVNAENGNRRTKKRRQHNLVGTFARGVVSSNGSVICSKSRVRGIMHFE